MYREFTEFQWAMMRLDAALTQRCDIERVAHIIKDQPKTAEAWLERGNEWYLSDGGYSRLFVSDDFKRICLDSVSTDRVKSYWDDTLDLRRYVERLLSEALEKLTRKVETQ
jgi:hypothetical protein